MRKHKVRSIDTDNNIRVITTLKVTAKESKSDTKDAAKSETTTSETAQSKSDGKYNLASTGAAITGLVVLMAVAALGASLLFGAGGIPPKHSDLSSSQVSLKSKEIK